MDNKRLSSTSKSSSSGHTSDKKSSTTRHTEYHRSTETDANRDAYSTKAKSDSSNDKRAYATRKSNPTEHSQRERPVVSKEETIRKITTADVTTASSNSQQKQKRIVQTFHLIWLDQNINEKKEYFGTCLKEFRKIVSPFEYFTATDQFIEHLKKLDQEKIILIISGMLGQKEMPRIHAMDQVDKIIVFCLNKDRHKVWAKEWSKIEGVHSSIKSVCKIIINTVHNSDSNNAPLKFMQKCVIAETASKEQNLGEFPPEHMYSAVFKEIILEIDENEANHIKDLTNYCREEGVDESELDYFQHEYYKKSPIWWYTADNFLHGMVNKALQTLDMKMMTKLGFFIRTLHLQLERLHKEQLADFRKEFIVYRGEELMQQEFQNLFENKGGLISFNNFLCTTKTKETTAKVVRRAMNKNPAIYGIIFILTIDPKKISTSKTPYALIDGYSAIPSEQEILFTMYTVFRVVDIKQTTKNTRLWEVELAIRADNDLETIAYSNRLKEETDGHGWFRMGALLLKVGYFSQAEELYNELLKNATRDNDKQQIYHRLAGLKNDEGEYQEAIECYEKSLKIKLQTSPKDDISLAPTYNNIGLAYNNMGDYSKAFEFYNKSLQICEKNLPSNHPSFTISYNNIGEMYNRKGNFPEALEFYEKAHKIYEKILPKTHPDLATSYKNMGEIYYKVGDCSKALELYEKSHIILEKILPPNHVKLANSYKSIAEVHCKLNDGSKALEFYERSHQILEKAPPSSHVKLATSYKNIGDVYFNMNDSSKALEFFEKSHKIYEEILPPNHQDLANSYHNIGVVYNNISDHLKALKFCKKSLEIREEVLPDDHLDFAQSYDHMALACLGLKDNLKALEYFEKALDVRQKSLPPGDPEIQNSLEYVIKLRFMMVFSAFVPNDE